MTIFALKSFQGFHTYIKRHASNSLRVINRLTVMVFNYGDLLDFRYLMILFANLITDALSSVYDCGSRAGHSISSDSIVNHT